MSLPNPGMSFTPLDPLPASDLNDIVENVEALQDWSAYDADSLPCSLLEDSAVTPEKLLTGTGTTWAWQTWTPTLTNITLGNGTQTAKYTEIGKTVHFYWQIVAGTTTTLTGGIGITLPVTAASQHGANRPLGTGWLDDAGIANFFLSCISTSTTTFSVQTWSASGTYVGAAGTVANNLPWAGNISNGDRISAIGTYEAA